MTPISVAFSRPEQAPPWEVLRELTTHLGEYLLVGAHARNIMCFGIADLTESAPRTHDVDVAIAVPRGEHGFAERVAALAGPRRTSRLTFTLPSLPGVPIDVIPYGPGVGDVEAIPLDRDRSLDATGMEEAAGCALRVRLKGAGGYVEVDIPPLHGQIALKLIAYGLRVEFPDLKDARDLRLLMAAASTGTRARNDCYDHGHLAPPRFDFDHDLLGPYLAGARILRDFGPKIARRVQGVARDPRLPGHAGARMSPLRSIDSRPSFAALADGLGDTGVAADPELGDPAAG